MRFFNHFNPYKINFSKFFLISLIGSIFLSNNIYCKIYIRTPNKLSILFPSKYKIINQYYRQNDQKWSK